MKFISFFLFLFFSFIITSNAAVTHAFFSSTTPIQGEIVIVKFLNQGNTIQSATFGGENVTFFEEGNKLVAVVGISATKSAGFYTFQVRFSNGDMWQKQIRVRSGKSVVVDLGIPKELGMTSTTLTQNLAKEKNNLNTIASVETAKVFQGRFGLPLSNNRFVTSVFGEIRNTEGTSIRHLGIDLKGVLGAHVGAINNGVVRKTYLDPTYGNTIILDHGKGIYSFYMHLNEIIVKEGMSVSKGKVIGTVGKTGYATSPHLHLSLKIKGVSVDPIAFVRIWNQAF